MSRSSLCFIACLASVLLTASLSAQTRPGTLVGVTNDGVAAGTGTLISIDSATGAGTFVATLNAPGVSLAFSDPAGTLYVSFTIREPAPARSLLGTLDPATGVATAIGLITDAVTGAEQIVAGMGFASDGTLYGVEIRSRSLVSIDTATAETTLVGSGIGVPLFNYGGTVVNDVFHLLTGNVNNVVSLYTVDLTTGAATFVGPTGISDNGIGLGVDGDGGLVAVINHTLYQVDPANGNAVGIGNTGFTSVSSLEFFDALHAACPCDASWKNHGQYVSCVAKAAKVISPGLRGTLISEAARSACGK